MADKILLENGTDRILLEDGSSLLLLDGADGGFVSALALWPFGLGAPASAGGVVVNIFSGRGGGAASPLVG